MTRAPFPYFGGKSEIAARAWEALGADATNYVEPFAGSLAVLLSRPNGAGSTETVNDIDGLLVNAWRGLKADPRGVADAADWPVSEIDLHARHLRLVAARESLTEHLIADPAYFDARLAAWWIWGACCWIGSGWCSGRGPWVLDGSGRVTKGNRGQGIHRQLPHLGNRGQGIHRQLPHLGDRGRGLVEWFSVLARRLERVRISCGEWRRVLGPSVTVRHGTTGVFLDPPYAADCHSPYAAQTSTVAAEVAAWAFENGGDPLLRIVLCGYSGEHTPPVGWRSVSWKARGGYGSQGEGRGRENAKRERLWLSPHCLPTSGETGHQRRLFGGAV